MTVQLKETFRVLNQPAAEQAPARRLDLDWLRVLAFCLLIFYHIGMLYVANWGYHYKSAYLSQWLESLMLLVNPWRMPLLWLVSGVAIRFVLSKVTITHFAGLRSLRLLLPLLVGILVIVPPQLYWEMTQNGDLSMSYLEFYRAFLVPGHSLFAGYPAGIWPHMDVNHLWYLRELWQFSLLIVLLLPVLRSTVLKRWIDKLSQCHAAWLFAVAALPVLIIDLAVDDNRNAIGLCFLLMGYLLGWHPGLWQQLVNLRRWMLTLALLMSTFMIVLYHTVWLGQSEHTPELYRSAMGVSYGLCRVLWLFAILGFGSVMLNRSSAWLTYFNEAVYPWYILHQSVLIVAAAMLAPYELGPWIEPLAVIAITLLSCGLGFEVIRRSSLLRPLFGLKSNRQRSIAFQRVTIALAILVLLPFGLEILI